MSVNIRLNELLEHFENDRELILEILEDFHLHYPSTIDQIVKATQEQNFEIIHRQGHTLKGQLRNFFCPDLESLAAQIEEDGKNKNIENIEKYLDDISNKLPQMVAKIKKELSD